MNENISNEHEEKAESKELKIFKQILFAYLKRDHGINTLHHKPSKIANLPHGKYPTLFKLYEGNQRKVKLKVHKLFLSSDKNVVNMN